eukprot:jgi/Orpsp1_1/1178897/evm.model.c7180000067144.1
MKLKFFEIFLFLICNTFLYHVESGIIPNISLDFQPKDQDDCRLYYNFFYGITIHSLFNLNTDNCCTEDGIKCDNEEYIISLG